LVLLRFNFHTLPQVAWLGTPDPETPDPETPDPETPDDHIIHDITS